MAIELTDFISHYDDVVSKDFCNTVVKSFELDSHCHDVVDRSKRPSFTQMNISEQYLKRRERWIDIQTEVQNVFREYIDKYIEDHNVGPDFPHKYAFEEYRIKRYLPNVDEFRDHVDVGDHSSARRFLVCFLYLNDVISGGETDFPLLEYSVKPKTGRLLIFPPMWLYRHAGRPVTEGKKYILGSYLHYL